MIDNCTKFYHNSLLGQIAYLSSESACFSFAFHEFEDISDSDWSFDVTDEVTFVSFFSGDEDDLDLGDTSS